MRRSRTPVESFALERAAVARCAILRRECVLVLFENWRYHRSMTEAEPLTPASSDDLEQAIAFALQFRGRKRIRTASDIMATLTAERIVEHLKDSGFVVMRKPPGVGAAALGRGAEKR